MVKLFAQYGQVDNQTSGNDYSIAGVGASVPVGELGKLLAQWSQIDPSAGAKRNTFSIGYDHLLSKRIDLYAVYMSDQLSGLDTGNNYGLGVRHRF